MRMYLPTHPHPDRMLRCTQDAAVMQESNPVSFCIPVYCTYTSGIKYLMFAPQLPIIGRYINLTSSCYSVGYIMT